MKKNLLFGFLMLLVLSTASFAGVSDPAKETDKIPARSIKENKLSDKEASRLNTKLEGKFSMDRSTLSNADNTLKKSANQIVVTESRHRGGYIWYGGSGLLLIILLVIILV